MSQALSPPQTPPSSTRKALGFIKWPLVGALIAGGALVVARVFGPKVARNIGDAGGEAFANGVARAQQELAAIRQRLSVSGRGVYGQRELGDVLQPIPGFAGAGLVIRNPESPRTTWDTVYEVRWLRDHPVPEMPKLERGYPVIVEVVDKLPVKLDTRGTYR